MHASECVGQARKKRSVEHSHKCQNLNRNLKMSKRPPLERIIVSVKTRITAPPVDTSVVLGHVATLSCRFSSAPSVKVEVNWYHDDVRVDGMAPQVTILKDGTLVIEQVRATDAGTYECEVRAIFIPLRDVPEIKVSSS